MITLRTAPARKSTAYLRRVSFIALVAVPLLDLSCPANPVQARSAAPEPASLRRFFSVLVVTDADQKANDKTQKKSVPPSEISLPEGKGRDTTKALCGKCHSSNIFAQQRHEREKWSSIIDNMVAKGMEATDDQLDEVTEYLAVHFAPEPSKETPAAPATPPAN